MIDVVEIKQAYVNERQKLDLQITKTFEDEDKEAYKDVVFGVYSKNDITVDDKVIIPEDGLVGTLTIDENGKNVEQLDLPTGDYYVKELETNVGFKLDEEEHDFTFNYDEDTTKATVIVPMELHNKKRRIELDVNKVDKDHHDHCSDICSHFSIFLYQSTTEIKEDRQRAAAGGIPDQETRREEKRIKEEKRIYQDKRIY